MQKLPTNNDTKWEKRKHDEPDKKEIIYLKAHHKIIINYRHMDSKPFQDFILST